MRKLDKILFKANKHDFKQPKTNHQFIQDMLKRFEQFKIKYIIKSDSDYFNALILDESLKNKQAFEECFENARYRLIDVWEHLTFVERNRLIKQDVNALKNKLNYFKYHDKVIWMACFDPLLNSLYHNELAILELPQYYRMYRVFKDIMLEDGHYGLAPYRGDYLQIKKIDIAESHVLFYHHMMKSIYQIDQHGTVIRLPLDREACHTQPLTQDLNHFRNYFTMDIKDQLECLISSNLISEKSKRDLIRLQKKLKIKVNDQGGHE